MARYLIDTSALIDFSKGFEPSYSRINQMIAGGDEVGVCPIVVAEFMSGIPVASRPIWDSLFRNMEFWSISYDAAVRAGTYRFTFARQGRQILTPDALVAAVAVEMNAILVTSNAKDFPMPEVSLMVP